MILSLKSCSNRASFYSFDFLFQVFPDDADFVCQKTKFRPKFGIHKDNYIFLESLFRLLNFLSGDSSDRLQQFLIYLPLLLPVYHIRPNMQQIFSNVTLSLIPHRMIQPSTANPTGRGGVFMGIVVVRSPRCLRGLLRRIFKVK